MVEEPAQRLGVEPPTGARWPNRALRQLAGCRRVLMLQGPVGPFFHDLAGCLRQNGIANLVITGITTDVCVSTALREANDRGYECLVLSDCCGATDIGNHAAALHMITMQGGVFGAVATSAALATALGEP